MEEAVERAASSLAPLMILLGVVAGVLIGLALLLRLRARWDRQAASGRRAPGAGARRDPAQADAGDSVSVLGRVYRVLARRQVHLGQGPLWLLALECDEGAARLLLDPEGGRAMCLPNRAEPPAAGPFPERLERPEGAFVRQGRTLEEGEGARLALYAGPQERWLLWEVRGEGATLFRGRSVPHEGVLVVEREAGRGER